MGTVAYTPNANIVANILNRRKETVIVDALRKQTVFDNLIKNETMFGDTLEHVQKSLAEKKNFCPKLVQSGKYVQQYLNKWYTPINWGKTYYDSITRSELRKAITPNKMADLISKIEGNNDRSWAYDFYYKCIDLLENDAEIPYIDVPDFSNFLTTVDKADRENLIERFIAIVLETMHDMSFYSNRYISVDSGLTAEQQGRLVATAPENELTFYINKTYSVWKTIDLTKRFSEAGIKMAVKVVDLQDSNQIGYLVHNGRLGYYPHLLEGDAEKQFGTGGRVDVALSVEGTFANIPLYPAAMFTIAGVGTGNPQPADKGTRYETVTETADSSASC